MKVQITKNFATLGDMTGDQDSFEMNQSINKNRKIAPLRDSFFLSLSGDALNLMEDSQLDACFNPSKLQFFVHKELTETGYEILSDGFQRTLGLSKLDGALSQLSAETRI